MNRACAQSSKVLLSFGGLIFLLIAKSYFFYCEILSYTIGRNGDEPLFVHTVFV